MIHPVVNIVSFARGPNEAANTELIGQIHSRIGPLHRFMNIGIGIAVHPSVGGMKLRAVDPEANHVQHSVVTHRPDEPAHLGVLFKVQVKVERWHLDPLVLSC